MTPSPISWHGVMPAITTPFAVDGSVDHAFLARHAAWLVEHGVSGLIALGTLGEGPALSFGEKEAVLATCVAAAGERVPVVAGIAAVATDDAVRLASAAAARGCRGLMVLPPQLHRGPWRETEAHLERVLSATGLPCMLYNNPIAYGTDVVAEQVAAMAARHDALQALKESSGDVRRITAVRALLGDRLALFVGLDDLIVEGVAAGAVGWVAGLCNALPAESVALFELARAGRTAEAERLYRWFLPLLRLDAAPEFVQSIKLVQQETGMGDERMRPPRLALAGAERVRALALIRGALSARPR